VDEALGYAAAFYGNLGNYKCHRPPLTLLGQLIAKQRENDASQRRTTWCNMVGRGAICCDTLSASACL
jgi:hypothetical protein